VRRLVELRGARVAWVDRHSAAGFVVPRIQLAAAGVDPRTELGEETFAGSHESVALSVVSGAVDFGATYAHRPAADGEVVGPWSALPDADKKLRVLTTFGKIPSDLIVARNDLDMNIRVRLTRALRAMNAHDTGRRIIHELFDVERFRLLDAETYDSVATVARPPVMRYICSVTVGYGIGTVALISDRHGAGMTHRGPTLRFSAQIGWQADRMP
jgi:ABC-type phosphate/phosphonate transport system substrate-binding protein